MDISHTLAPKSDQLQADDFLVKSGIFTIESVTDGPSEQQPLNIHLVESPGRPFRACKTVRRLIALGWGTETDVWIGRKLELYNDQSVTFGGKKTGGVRVSRMSDIKETLSASLTKSQGQKGAYVISPLLTLPTLTQDGATEFESRFANAATVDELKTIAADLKAFDLGGFRDSLMAAYQKRGNEIEASHE